MNIRKARLVLIGRGPEAKSVTRRRAGGETLEATAERHGGRPAGFGGHAEKLGVS